MSSATKQSLRTREVIRLSAEKLFHERGYAAIGMRELAKEVGIEAPSIYNHYKSKDDLLREICFDMANRFFSAVDQSVDENTSPSKQLKAAINAHISVIAGNTEAAEVFFHEWMFLDQPHLSKFKTLRKEYEKRFEKIIQLGAKRRSFKKDHLQLTLYTLFASMNSSCELFRIKKGIKASDISEAIAEIILTGIKK